MSPIRSSQRAILSTASELVGAHGFARLSIGGVARELDRPKGTILYHYHSLERLQLAVLDQAARQFNTTVIVPARQHPAGLCRLAWLFSYWLRWDATGPYPGGCLLLGAARELAQRPGILRDRLRRFCGAWHRLLHRHFARAIAAGRMRPDVDQGQWLQDFHGIMLAHHTACRLFRDAQAEARAQQAFADLLERSLPAGAPPRPAGIVLRGPLAIAAALGWER